MLRNHPSLREEMGGRARQLFKEQFNASRLYAEFVAHLEKIADQASMRNAETYN